MLLSFVQYGNGKALRLLTIKHFQIMYKVFFKGKDCLPSVCVFNASHLEIAVEAALALHRMSNLPHEIDVREQGEPETALIQHLHLDADFFEKKNNA